MKLGLVEKKVADRLKSGEDVPAKQGEPKRKTSAATKVSLPASPAAMLERSKADKVKLHEFWELTKRFTVGAQWPEDAEISKLGSQVRMKLRLAKVSRVTVNLMLNYYRSILAKLSMAYPSIAVLPASPSTEDIGKATSSETALQYHWWAAKVPEMLTEAIEHLLVYGTAGIHTFYSEDLGRVAHEVISPFNLFFEADISRIEDSEWIAIRTYHTREALMSAYQSTKQQKYIDEAATAALDDVGDLPKQPRDRLELYTIYFKDGREAHVIGDHYLYSSNSRSVPTMPVDVLRYTHVPEIVWGIAALAPVVSLQYWYNRQRSKIVENAELVGNPKILEPLACGISDASFTNSPGERIQYNNIAGSPKYLEAPPMPSYVLDSLSRFQSEISEVIGFHSTSLGRRAVGIESAKAIDALASKDASQLQVTQTDIEAAFVSMAETTLMLMKLHYREPKWQRMMDNTGRVAFNYLEQTNIVDDPEIHIQAGTMFRSEAQDRDARIMGLAQAQLIPPEDALEALSYRTGNVKALERVANMSRAQEQLERLLAGEPIEIFAQEDIQAYSKVFVEFARSKAWYTTPEPARELISKVLTSLNTLGQSPEQVAAYEANQQVYPKPPPPPPKPQIPPPPPAMWPMPPMAQEPQRSIAQEANVDPVGQEVFQDHQAQQRTEGVL